MPPPLPRGVLSVSEGNVTSNIVCLMKRRRYIIEKMSDNNCDFLCTRACVLYVDNLNKLCDLSYRDFIYNRISASKIQFFSTGRIFVLLLLVGPQDPRPDILAWLSLQCSIELNCNVMLCWTEEECASYLEGLMDSFVASVDYRVARKKESTPIPVLIEAFTQTPQLMMRNDVVRAAHRFGSIANLLSATSDDLANLPGFGQKKAHRLSSVLNASFSTSHQLISDVLPNSEDFFHSDNIESRSQSLPARKKMLHVLDRIREIEMDETMNE